MNSGLYKKLQDMSESLIEAAEADNEALFYSQYAELEALCESYLGGKQNHPALWETLADFTEDNDRAIEVYNQAFALADKLKENEYKASIQFSLGQRLIENSRMDEARDALLKAQKFAAYTEDLELVEEVNNILDSLST